MPRLDGTGPMGQGPRTGFGMGRCPRCPLSVRGSAQAPLTKEQELEILKENKDILEKEIADLEKSK